MLNQWLKLLHNIARTSAAGREGDADDVEEDQARANVEESQSLMEL